MAKHKLQHFAEIKTFSNVVRLSYEDSLKGFEIKGKWKENYFKNNDPIIIELGCGKGEYTVSLAKKYPEKNFIGIDIKGNRIWRGAKTALDEKIKNVAFVQTRVDFIESCFSQNEVDEIWITFPDPQLQKPRKRLTSTMFLDRYKNIIAPGCTIHLKTDNKILYEYTLDIISEHKLRLVCSTDHLYEDATVKDEQARSIQTFYESKYLKQGKPIHYLKFCI